MEEMLLDYVHLSLGLLALHSATAATTCSSWPAASLEGSLGNSRVAVGSYAKAKRSHGGLRESLPSGYAAAVEVMWRLGGLLSDKALRESGLRAARSRCWPC